MPTIPCRNGINCQPCLDEPISNFSAESPDDPLFCQTVTFRADIPLGLCIDQIQSTEICCTGASDLEAYLCALREAQENVYNTWRNNCAPPLCPPFCTIGCPPPPCAPAKIAPNCEPNCPQPPDNFIGLYYNDAQTCSSTCPDGSPFTLTVPHGRIVALNQTEANAQAYALACKLAREYKICISVEGPTTGCKNQPMSFTLRANGILTQFPLDSYWTITGPGIAGNVLNYDNNSVFGSVTMVISGTPTILVSSYIIARITDPNTGYYMERSIPISVGEIATTLLANGSVNSAYSQMLSTTGLSSPLTFSVLSGSLPDGLSLNASTGEISGTPTTSGVSNFTIRVTDSNGAMCSKQLSITIGAAVCSLIDHFDCTSQTTTAGATIVVRLRWRYIPNVAITTVVERSTDQITWTNVGTVVGLSLQTGDGFDYNQTLLLSGQSLNTQYYFRVKPSTCTEYSSVLPVLTLSRKYQISGLVACGLCSTGWGPDNNATLDRVSNVHWVGNIITVDQFFGPDLNLVANQWVFSCPCDGNSGYFTAVPIPFSFTLDHCPFVMPHGVYTGDGNPNQCVGSLTLVPTSL